MTRNSFLHQLLESPRHFASRRIVPFCCALILMMASLSPSAHAIGACPPIGYSPSCAVVITIGPTGALTFQFDPSVGPYDGADDTLVGVVNNSGATVFGISLSGNDIFGFDGDGAGAGGDYAGPGVSFTIKDANNGTVNFPNGLADKGFLWFSLEGPPSAKSLSYTVTIDPGHGGTQCNRDADGNPVTGGDTGATGVTNFKTAPVGKLTEHQLAFAIGTSLQSILNANGAQSVTITRTDDVNCPTLAERVAIANNAKTNFFVSIHFNGAAPAASGSQVWYQPSKSSSKTLATFMVGQIASGLGLAKRGPKGAGVDGKNLYVLNRTVMTSVLAEVAFLSNLGDEAVMHNASSIGASASAIKAGIDAFVAQ